MKSKILDLKLDFVRSEIRFEITHSLFKNFKTYFRSEDKSEKLFSDELEHFLGTGTTKQKSKKKFETKIVLFVRSVKITEWSGK